MPRKKAKKGQLELPSSEPRVTFLRNEQARRLVSVDHHDPAWMDAIGHVKLRADAKDAIVRVCPPADASDEDIAAIEAALRNDGAMIIRTIPRAPAGKPVVAARGQKDAQSMPARKVVEEMVNGATASHDKEALAAFCETVMSEEGL